MAYKYCTRCGYPVMTLGTPKSVIRWAWVVLLRLRTIYLELRYASAEELERITALRTGCRHKAQP